jgi:NTE family protein
MDITLALGGGGAKGNAHIGVLRVLLREGFRIRGIAGTSAGGLAAAAYAAGNNPDEIEAFMQGVDQSKLYGSWPSHGPGLLSIAGVRSVLTELIGNRCFEDLPIPCAVTAVDIDAYIEVILKRGSVVDALLATIAIPGVFPPKKWGEHRLVDGGVMDPVPVSVARSLAPGLPVVAVVLTPPLKESSALSPPKIFSTPPVLEPITRLRVAQAFDIFVRSIDIGARMLSELHLLQNEPDVIIRPAVENIGLLEKVNVSEIVKFGEIAADSALPELRQAVSWRGRVKRRLRSLRRSLQ